MSESILTLRELFQISQTDVSVGAESGIDGDVAAKSVQEAIARESRALRWPWVRHAIADQTSEILNMNVLDALGEAWKKIAEVEEYADPAKHSPSEKNLLPLAEHTISSEHHPFLKVLFRGQEIGRLTFELKFSLILEGFVLVIQNARIMEIQAGRAKGEGSLSLTSVPVWKREWGPLEFPGQISLGSGIPVRSSLAAASGTVR
jgi:hypothetical protein